MDAGIHGDRSRDRTARNLRTALLLGALALAFGVGFWVRMWLTS